MRLLKLLILPLIISSLISGSASLNARMNGRIALRTLIYFVITSLFNAFLGICLVLLIQPGAEGMQQHAYHSAAGAGKTTNLLDSLLDLGRFAFAILWPPSHNTRFNVSFYSAEIYFPTICSRHRFNKHTPFMCQRSRRPIYLVTPPMKRQPSCQTSAKCSWTQCNRQPKRN